ncbi:Fc.00g056230.m01.CDS01 [Cosmosporella sp. VM-42]
MAPVPLLVNEDATMNQNRCKKYGFFYRSLGLSAYLGVVKDYSALWTRVEELPGRILLTLIAEELDIHDERPIFGCPIEHEIAWLESIEERLANRKFPKYPPRKRLPHHLGAPDDFECQSAIAEIRGIGYERLEPPLIAAAGDHISHLALALSVALCGCCGYMPERILDDPKLFLFRLLSTQPPVHGRVRDIGGGNLEKLFKEQASVAIDTRGYLSKEVFYWDAPWPESKDSDQTRGEVKVLTILAPKLAIELSKLQNLIIFDLGAGSSDKSEILLGELEHRKKICQYYSVDINQKSLEGNVSRLSKKYTSVRCGGLHGTFEDAWEMTSNIPGNKVAISWASTLTNFSPKTTIEILRRWSKVTDRIIIGQQAPDWSGDLHSAYHTAPFEQFIRDGLMKVARVLEREVLKNDNWVIKCKEDREPYCHTFLVRHPNSQEFPTFASFKYTEKEFSRMAHEAGLMVAEISRDENTGMRIYDLCPAEVPRKPLTISDSEFDCPTGGFVSVSVAFHAKHMDSTRSEPSQQGQSSRSDPGGSSRPDAVMSALQRGLQGEEDWSDGGPQTDEEVSALFSRLTLMDSYSRQDRRKMECKQLLEAFARRMDPKCQLHIMTLAGASVVAIGQKVLATGTARDVMRINLKDPDSVLDKKRRATAKFVRILDVLHAYQALGLRTYELPIRRKNILNTISGFTERHIDILIERLKGDTNEIFKPENPLDSTCLRIPNVIYVLFAGRFSRDRIEQSFNATDSGSRSEQAKVRGHYRITSFCQFISLNDESERERQKAIGDTVGLAPTFQRPRLQAFGMPEPYLRLGSFVQALNGLIEATVEGKGWRVMDFKGAEEYPPQVLRLEEGAAITVPSGFLGLALLLREQPVATVILPDNQEVVWKPNQVFCLMGKSLRAKDGRNKFYFWLTLLQLQPN